MTRNNIIKMAREAGFVMEGDLRGAGRLLELLARFAALVAAAEREKVARWMRSMGYATGHGDTIEDLLSELGWQTVEAEREACARVCAEYDDDGGAGEAWAGRFAAAIRARGQQQESDDGNPSF